MKPKTPLIRIIYFVAAFFLTAGVALAAADAKKTYSFHSQRTAGGTDRVVVLLEVGGETKFLENGKPRREKMGVVCSLDYLEKTLDAPKDADGAQRAVRLYRKAAAAVKVGEGQFQPALKPEHSLIGVEAGRRSALLYSPNGPLSREELDAIDIQINSLLLDRLLPQGPIVVGQGRPLDEDLLAAMLGLDEVSKSDVRATLKEVVEPLARFELTGTVKGTAGGAATEIELKGRFRFDLRWRRVDWLGLLIKEDRRIGPSADGVEAVSRLQITVAPAKEAEELADAALAKLDLNPGGESACLVYVFPGGGGRCVYDRKWYADPASGVLRMIEGGTLVGQCNLALLPKRDPDKLVTLEAFQEDVRKALGENFGAFVAARESVNGSGCRELRVVVDGAVPGNTDKVPARWIYYHLADSEGRQAALTFTIERENVERFAESDRPIVDSVRFDGR